jgi:hypothetical protein
MQVGHSVWRPTSKRTRKKKNNTRSDISLTANWRQCGSATRPARRCGRKALRSADQQTLFSRAKIARILRCLEEIAINERPVNFQRKGYPVCSRERNSNPIPNTFWGGIQGTPIPSRTPIRGLRYWSCTGTVVVVQRCIAVGTWECVEGSSVTGRRFCLPVAH